MKKKIDLDKIIVHWVLQDKKRGAKEKYYLLTEKYRFSLEEALMLVLRFTDKEQKEDREPLIQKQTKNRRKYYEISYKTT